MRGSLFGGTNEGGVEPPALLEGRWLPRTRARRAAASNQIERQFGVYKLLLGDFTQGLNVCLKAFSRSLASNACRTLVALTIGVLSSRKIRNEAKRTLNVLNSMKYLQTWT